MLNDRVRRARRETVAWLVCCVLLVCSPTQLAQTQESSTDEQQAVELEIEENTAQSDATAERLDDTETVAQADGDRTSDDDDENVIETVQTPDIFIPSEDISEDIAVPFPVDI